MMYIHYCRSCELVFMLNGHKTKCPRCGKELHELKLSFIDYTNMLPLDRELLKRRLALQQVDIKR